MKLVIEGRDLNERLQHVTMDAGCQGETCTTHDGCGEQCNHSLCRCY